MHAARQHLLIDDVTRQGVHEQESAHDALHPLTVWKRVKQVAWRVLTTNSEDDEADEAVDPQQRGQGSVERFSEIAGLTHLRHHLKENRVTCKRESE